MEYYIIRLVFLWFYKINNVENVLKKVLFRYRIITEVVKLVASKKLKDTQPS